MKIKHIHKFEAKLEMIESINFNETLEKNFLVKKVKVY